MYVCMYVYTSALTSQSPSTSAHRYVRHLVGSRRDFGEFIFEQLAPLALAILQHISNQLDVKFPNRPRDVTCTID